MVTITQDGKFVTFINGFRVEPANQARLVAMWIEVSETYFKQVPGLISASLHRSRDGTRVVNYAQWESAAAWKELVASWRDRFRAFEEFSTPDPHLYDVVHVMEPHRAGAAT
jgi:hypothetical protein